MTELNTAESAERVLNITRVIDAPRELVWKAWTEPGLMMRWWGPTGFTAPVCNIDLRVGGAYLSCMRSPEGKDYWSTGVYREITPQQRIVCTDSFADEQGKVIPATAYGMSAEFPLEMMLTVTFEADDGKTRLTLQHVGLPPGEDLENCRAGWNQSLDKLSEMLAEGWAIV